MKSVDEQIEWVGTRLARLKKRLEEMGYQFAEPKEVLPGPGEEVEEGLARLKAEVGPVPRALELFYRKIGSVNFMGKHSMWRGCDYPDPIIVYPIAAALEELDQFLADREEYTRCYGGFRAPIAPDYYHKADVSGGMWYGIALPDVREDPPVLEEWHKTTFLKYLELAIGWSGFPGLKWVAKERQWPIEQHSWPVEEMTWPIEQLRRLAEQ